MDRKKMDSAALRQSSGKRWEEKTRHILEEIFPDDIILSQITTPQIPRARPDFAVVRAGLIIECKACGLTPVQEKELAKHKRTQDLFESLGMTYVWWVDRERDSLVGWTRSYLKYIFYNCKGERTRFIEFLKSFACGLSLSEEFTKTSKL